MRAYEIHKKEADHDYRNKNITSQECNTCKSMEIHTSKAISARQEYQKDVGEAKDQRCVSADLQKV